MNALLTTLHVLAGSATGGMHLAHIALATLGITAASDARNDVKCFLFHDEDRANELGNYEFGRLVAVRLLAAFTDAYAPSGALGACVNKAAFAAFAARLLDVIAGADRDILRELRCTPGVSNCIVVADAAGASTAAALGHQATVAAAEIEEIGFLANFRSFVAYSEELSLSSPALLVYALFALALSLSLSRTWDAVLSANDRGVFSCVDTPRERITISRLTFGSLVVVSSKSKDAAAIMPQVAKAVYHLEKRLLFPSLSPYSSVFSPGNTHETHPPRAVNMFLAAVKGT